MPSLCRAQQPSRQCTTLGTTLERIEKTVVVLMPKSNATLAARVHFDVGLPASPNTLHCLKLEEPNDFLPPPRYSRSQSNAEIESEVAIYSVSQLRFFPFSFALTLCRTIDMQSHF